MLNRARARGIIAISTLMVSVVLLILILTLLISLRNGKSSILRDTASKELLFLAEAGLADATYQLSVDNSWNPTTAVEYDFPDGKGKYTIVFDNGGSLEPDESVHNLLSSSPVTGHPSLGNIPAFSVGIVVAAEHKGQVVNFGAIISRGKSEPITVPLLTSGKIHMKGEVLVSGIESLSTPLAVPAGLHSNSFEDAAGIIDWDGEGNDAYISGDVTTTSTNAGAVTTTGGAFNSNSVDTGRGSHQFPIVNVEQAMLGGITAPVLIPSVGGTTVVSGDRQWGGGTITGDLELNGAKLYVNGNLTVNGTIKGDGALYVNGNTTFRGSSELGNSSGSGLALFSKGNVALQGFRGSDFLDDLGVADPGGFGVWNDDAKWAHDEMLSIISSPANYGVLPPNPTTWGSSLPGNQFDQLRTVLGEAGPGVPPGRTDNTLQRMIDYMAANYPGDESATFMVDRLTEVRKLYEAGTTSGLPPATLISNFNSGSGEYAGVLDIINQGNYVGAAANGASEVGDQNFDRLGTSYFQGMIYTNGAVYAYNEVEVVGALLAHRTTASTPGGWNIGGETLEAGDVYLAGGSSLVYNQELMEDPFQGTVVGPVVVSAWLGELP